jgi:hypothetical protein
MMTGSEKQLRESLFTDHLRIPCNQVRLRHRGEDESLNFAGSGFIRQQKGHIVLELLPTECPAIGRWFSLRQEKEVPEYRLECQTPEGNRYEANNIRPQLPHFPLPHIEKPLVQAHVPELIGTRKWDVNGGQTRAEISIPSELPIAANTITETRETVGEEERLGSSKRDRAKFTVGEHQFEIHRLDGEDRTDIYLSMPPESETRVLESVTESLEFLFADKMPGLFATILSDGRKRVVMRCVEGNRASGILPPPIHKVGGDCTEDVWRLYGAYFEHIMNWEGRMPCPLTAFHESVLSSGMEPSPPEVFALTVCVAIEGIADHLPDAIIDRPSSYDGQIDALKNHVIRSTEYRDVENRVLGLLGMMSDVGGRDKLEELANREVIGRKEVKAWKRLRNASAHGDRAHSPASGKWWLDLWHVVDLFHKLILQTIGYDGAYIAYHSSNKEEFHPVQFS